MATTCTFITFFYIYKLVNATFLEMVKYMFLHLYSTFSINISHLSMIKYEF